MTQAFKGDEIELKMTSVASGILLAKSLSLSEFFEGCYSTQPFGAMIYDEARAPLSNAIVRQIFIETFSELFDSFRVAGSFESYLSVFIKIFGETVSVVFAVPAPGKLSITIVADTLELSEFAARRIQNNTYVFDGLITQDEDEIVFQTIKGFQSQYELEQMLFEMVPYGISTNISLTFGES